MFVKKKWRKMPLLNEEHLAQQLSVVVDFIKMTHPYLEQANNPYSLEIRPIVRGDSKGVRPCRLFDLSPSSIEQLAHFLKQLNGKRYCIFYALSAAQKSSRIHNSSEVIAGTYLLPIDLDDCDYESYRKVKDKLLSLNIETLDIYTGHGFQLLIILNKLEQNPKIFKYFTELMVRKGFPVDSQIVDSARLFRLPATFNTKYFDTESFIYQTEIVDKPNRTYEAKEIFNLLHQLPDVETTVGTDMIDVHVLTQDLIDNMDAAPIPVKKMLLGAPEGIRNITLVFLVRYLNAYTNLSNKDKIKYLLMFAENCKPSLPANEVFSTFKRMSKYENKVWKIYYPKELGRKFGFISFIDKPSDYFYIPSTLFKHFKDFKNQSIRLYVRFLEMHYREKADSYNKSKLLEVLSFKPTTFENNMRILTKYKLITKKKATRTSEAVFYITPYFNLDEKTLRLPINLLPKLIELKYQELYVFLAHVYITKNSRETYLSQETLSQITGYTQQNISIIMKSLVQKNYIKEQKTYLRNHFIISKYELNLD